jgi:hypothetical protein
VNLGFGDGWNAPVTPVFGLRARGQILGWTASGHIPVSPNNELSSKCRGIGGKVWLTPETPLERIGKKTICTTEGKKLSECPGVEEREVVYKEFKRETSLTDPWSVELVCRDVEIEEGVFEYEGIVRVGVADKNSKHGNFGEENKTGRKTQAELKAEEEKLRTETEAEQTTQEGEGKHGQALELKSCYAKRGVPGDTPAGCIRFDLVSPAQGFEDPYSGSLRALGHNGSAPTAPSEWKFAKTESGQLQCENEGSTAFLVTGGSIKEMGTSVQLMQAH